MRRCEYCGHENGDEARHCLGCGTQFLVPTGSLREFEPQPLNLKKHLLMCCGIYGDGFVRRAPIFGVLSLSSPMLGFVSAYVANGMTDFGGGDMRGFAALCQFIGIVLLALLAGGLFALAGLLRGERCRGLSFAGLVVGWGSIIWIILERCVRGR